MATATPSAPTLRKPDLATDRPTAPRPIWHNIPAELQARRKWVCWRYETRDGKPTKVPYNARTAAPASTSAPPTWSTFEQAKQAYLDMPHFYDGIGYVFSKNDPYCGADFDHCINDAGEISTWAAGHIARLQASGAYTETSVSGSGVHAIVLATFGKGLKRALGEIYDRGRFFTFSGQRLESSTPIGDGQAAIDALAAELRGSTNASDKPARDAGQLTEHSAEEWEQARQLLRTQRDRLLQRFLAATARNETQQGYFAARGLWAELHARWSFIGLYRADGALDDSQARAVMASSIRPRGFTFAEYVVIMSHHFAAYCLAKWGSKDAWRAELERLWSLAPAAKHAPAQARPAVAVPKKPRGRASNHAEQVERVYGLLLDHRAGAQALVQTAELASEAGMHRVTLACILAELRSAGRISTERAGRYAGLVVSFPDVAIVAPAEAAQPATVAQTAIEPAAPLEETRVPNRQSCVSSEQTPAGYSSPQVEQPTLAELAAAYLDDPEAGRLGLRSKATGEAVRRHTARHFAELVEPYGYMAQQARAAYKAEQDRRAAIERAEWARFFAQLKAMTDAELLAYVNGGCRREVAELARQHSGGAAPFDRHKYQARLRCAKQNLAWRGVELTRKPAQPSARPSKPARTKPTRLQACQPLRFEQHPLVEQHQVEPAPTLTSLLVSIQTYHARQAGQQRPAAAD